MAKVDPQQAADKWKTRLSGATTEITNGVQRVKVAPGQAAAANKAAWLAKVTAAQDKWARNVARVPLDQWQKLMTDVGIPRIAQGAQAKAFKVQNFMSEFLPYLDRGVANVKGMPNVTIEDGINRAVAMIRWNAQFKRSGNAGPASPGQ